VNAYTLPIAEDVGLDRADELAAQQQVVLVAVDHRLRLHLVAHVLEGPRQDVVVVRLGHEEPLGPQTVAVDELEEVHQVGAQDRVDDEVVRTGRQGTRALDDATSSPWRRRSRCAGRWRRRRSRPSAWPGHRLDEEEPGAVLDLLEVLHRVVLDDLRDGHLVGEELLLGLLELLRGDREEGDLDARARMKRAVG
jgi:hypothetical protein